MNRLAVFRAIDKLDRLGPYAVYALLTEGRKDASGDMTSGAGLCDVAAEFVMAAIGFVFNDLTRRWERGVLIMTTAFDG